MIPWVRFIRFLGLGGTAVLAPAAMACAFHGLANDDLWAQMSWGTASNRAAMAQQYYESTQTEPPPVTAQAAAGAAVDPSRPVFTTVTRDAVRRAVARRHARSQGISAGNK